MEVPGCGRCGRLGSPAVVFLRQLTLKGFKSFAETTALSLEPGVTVVVGPNGSGKSNVVDAIAWVLGAQAPSSVRSQKMDDVIFAGTAKRAPLGRAEVSLTIDNSAGLLPIELTEVTITRTLWRSGDSEYAINGVPCRLLDVQELLSDSGVGRQQHVIVGQGQIDAVLNARPEDRRSIVEEAAGVLKYRKRKEKAERRLESTEGSLLRVQDLLREVRRQLRPLERQADAARRHGDLVGELSALRVHLAGRELAGLRSRLQAVADQRLDQTAARDRLRGELATLDSAVLAAEVQLRAAGASDVGDRLGRVEQLRERARGLSAVLGERKRALERERIQLMDASVAANLEAEAARLRSELAEVIETRGTLDPEMASLAVDEGALAALFAAGSGADEVGGSGGNVPASPSATSAAAEVRGELRTRRVARERDERERRQLAAVLAASEGRQAELDRQLADLKAVLVEQEAAEAALVAELERAQAQRGEGEVGARRAAEERQEVIAQRVAVAARVDALVLALDEARARAGAKHLADVEGVLGTLLDVVQVDAGWEAAFEAAAGEALSALVVADTPTGRLALEHLDRAGLSGGVLAPPDPGEPGNDALGSGPTARPEGGGEPLRPHVRAADPQVGRLLDRLLDRAVAVQGGWREALDLAVERRDAVVVTRDGDRFAAGGWRLGSSGPGATVAALDDARGRLAELESAVVRLDSTRAEADAQLRARHAVEARAMQRLDEHDAATRSAAALLTRLANERGALEQEAASGRIALTAATERVQQEDDRIAELAGLLIGLEADEASEAERARHEAQRRAAAEAETRRLSIRRRDLEVRVAGLDERRSLVERRLADVERRLADGEVEAAAEAQRAKATRLERSAVAVDRLARLVADHRETIDGRLVVLQEERRRQTDEARATSTRLDGLRQQRAEVERTMTGAVERERRLEIEDAEIRMRLEAAIEVLRRDLDTEPDVAMASEEPALPPGSSASSRARELERELRLMGPINPLALEEWAALQERHQFLEAQLEDVRSTRRELQRVIRSVDAEIQTVFASAFADVSENFSALFETLFPGGAGRLVLTAPDDLLGTGIEVEAKPSGKNVKKLSLLSGGERSLTALAFLFAVFRSRPSPFYVMDEVEAALDDVNLHRFLGLIEEFRHEAQLVVVSHQKRTMEAADCLIGVTMQPGGSSKVVSEQVGAGAP